MMGTPITWEKKGTAFPHPKPQREKDGPSWVHGEMCHSLHGVLKLFVTNFGVG
jgi:hypothetical protein